MSPTMCIIILVTGYLPFVRVDLSLRVIKGDVAHPEQYPYIVALVRTVSRGQNLAADVVKISRYCSGTAVTPRWILTAAHCAVTDPEFVQYGNMSLTPTETVTKSAVLESIMHPNYKYKVAANDIALLRVEPVDIKMFGKISSVHYETLFGVAVKFAGYGWNKTNLTDLLVMNKQPLLIGEGVVSTCVEDDDDLAEVCICVYSKCSNGQYIYPGDSGGPLLFSNKVVGVVSQGRPTLHMGMSTPVSMHLNWITGVLSSHNEISSQDQMRIS